MSSIRPGYRAILKPDAMEIVRKWADSVGYGQGYLSKKRHDLVRQLGGKEVMLCDPNPSAVSKLKTLPVGIEFDGGVFNWPAECFTPISTFKTKGKVIIKAL